MQKAGFIYLLLLISCLSWGNNPKSLIWTEETLRSMSLDEKIGQLFMIAVYSNKGEEYEEKIEQLIKEYQVGGLIFFQGEPVKQVHATNRWQKAAKYPLLIGLDAEHGVGWRLQTAMEFPRMLLNGAISDDSLLFRLGATIGRHCREMGVHVNFAPVVDINNNPLNPVIGTRSFGEDRKNVYKKAAMYIAGSLSEGVLPVAKHFPGHGDTDTDSHKALPLIQGSRERLDSVELYPFKKLITDNQLPAIMVAHLNVPNLDSTGRPSTLSPLIVKKYLREELGFNGLCFTDAMNMKGVTSGREKGEAEVQALLAGNDILLFPENLRKAVAQIKQAIKDSVLAEADIDEKCRKILLAKYTYVLPNLQPLKAEGLWSRLNSPEDFALKHALYQQAVTLIKNQANLLPFKHLDTLRFASVNFGEDKINNFQTTLSKYAPVTHFSITNQASGNQMESLLQKLAPYNCIILYNSHASDKVSRNFGYSITLSKLISALKGKKVVFCHPGIPYGLRHYIQLPVDAFLIHYEDHLYARQYAAQALFGGIPVKGKLPVSIHRDYPAGSGISTPQTRLGYTVPELCQVASASLNAIDSLCRIAIHLKATPGCQVLVAKDNYIIYNKAFGYNTYAHQQANHTSNIYDIASVTKIAATLPAIMKLYDENKIQLDKPASFYYPPLRETNKKNLSLKEILAHNGGLKSFIPCLANAIDLKSIPGRLYTTVPTKYNTLKLKKHVYLNPNYQFKDSTLSRTPQPGFEPLTPGLYIFKNYRDTVLQSILESELTPTKEYLYSDVGFILLQKVAETVSGTSLDTFCQINFFRKLGAYNTAYKASEHLNQDYIIPSCIDKIYRKKEIKGFVHDPMAAALGGVAGNAGLFSTAEDLAKIMALYLNEGHYGGENYFSPATVSLFTQKNDCFPDNRRALGFDKPETDSRKPGPTCQSAPISSFGHMGFTGTIAWADPENRLIYIFLSNRTYPDEFNTKLSEENIRTQIQEAIYQAIQPQKDAGSR